MEPKRKTDMEGKGKATKKEGKSSLKMKWYSEETES
jgi:hypothetical protein